MKTIPVKIKGLLQHRWLLVTVGALIFLVILFKVIDLISPLPGFARGYSTMIYSSDGQIIHGFLSKDQKWRIRADQEEVSAELCKAVIFKEDKYFYFHPGVNPVSVVRALYNNTIKGRRTSGASTITMQLARMLNPAPRTFKSKLRETFRALQLECHYTKKEILLMYLNLLPYGGNIEGVKAASMIYFGQLPCELSPAQVAMLTVIPNNPNVLKPQNHKILLQNRNYWLKRMGERKIFTQEQITDALAEDFETRHYPVPRQAPHLSYRLKAESESDRIVTSLNMLLQNKAESAVRNYIRGLRSMQINNAAVLIVNNHTMNVEAYIGSAGFDENQYSGQVDGVQAIRSPGSALKPMLYMLAFDRGLVSPKTVVSDVPVNFNGYRPENYDESYRGSVSIEQALALSLNVPAVDLLDKMGLNDLTGALASTDFKWIAGHKKKVGLSLILGGCGATLEELTGMYAAFANQGVWRPLHYVTEATVKDGSIRIGSPGSAWLITEILTGLKRPDLPNEYQMTANLLRVAWKTGTSYGRRDGWAIGYNEDYTIGVWIGNFIGNGIPELNGTDCAVPLLFMLFNQIGVQNTDWFKPTPDIDFRLVCSETGMIPDTFCHNQVMENYLPGISPSVRCNHMKVIFTNKEETMSYCSDCVPATGYKTVLYPNLPPQLVSYYEEMNIPYKKIPEHNRECNSLLQEKGPVITSLTDGAEYLVIAGRHQHLMLKSISENGTAHVFWYINKKFYKKSAPAEVVYFEATKGSHTITCSDDKGRSSTINIRVSMI